MHATVLLELAVAAAASHSGQISSDLAQLLYAAVLHLSYMRQPLLGI